MVANGGLQAAEGCVDCPKGGGPLRLARAWFVAKIVDPPGETVEPEQVPAPAAGYQPGRDREIFPPGAALQLTLSRGPDSRGGVTSYAHCRHASSSKPLGNDAFLTDTRLDAPYRGVNVARFAHGAVLAAASSRAWGGAVKGAGIPAGADRPVPAVVHVERVRRERLVVTRDQPPRVGGLRRRGSGLEEAIRRATVELLAAVGYESMTMEQVALRARTGKAALYRRWATKSELVLDALLPFVELDEPIPDTGTLRGDVLSVLEAIAASMHEPMARGAAAALAEFPAAPSRRSGLRAKFLQRRREALEAVLQRAAQRGEIPPPNPLLAQTALALLVYRMLTADLPIPAAEVHSFVDEVVLPLARAPRVSVR